MLLVFIRDTEEGCISTRGKSPEEECNGVGSGDEGDEDGAGPAANVVSLVFLFPWEELGIGDSLLLSFLFLFSLTNPFSFPLFGGK